MIRRGEIRLVDLEPERGADADKRRHAVDLSNDWSNYKSHLLRRGVVTVVPVTSNVQRVHPFQVLLPAASTGLDRDSKAQAEQVRSVDVERLGAAIGQVDSVLIDALDAALRLHLAL